MQKILEIAKQIGLVIFDVDGVFTDGGLIFDETGREYKVFNVKDGHGIKMLRDGGVEVAVISGRESKSVALRMASLGIKYVYQGQDDKRLAFNELCATLPINPKHVAYVGDDLPDLRLFSRVGLAIAVADAHYAVRHRADWCTSLAGGRGAVREVCDLILTAKGTLDAAIEALWLPDGDAEE
jgi:3-deoxy-D-manno-octulosonate 8-phosphate phosphatase (KDO 8-P phosphatase)